MSRPIITFLSDFGHADWFVGVVHGVLHSLAPDAHVVDLAHSIPPGHVARGAFMLEASCPDFPPGTVHRLTAVEDTTIVEVSTPQLDDVVRLEDRYGREGTTEA